ncbi:hypothetical protein KM043_008691 [Ampulex compressa]|nr:hypothetical protein KM043_008691 [Ampulex compressa]
MKRISLLIVLVTFLFTRRISHTAARLVLLRGRSIEHRYYYSERRLVCVSEDDDSALVWNTNLQWTYKSYEFSDRTGNLQFRSTYPYTMRQPNCNFAPTEECKDTWKGNHWTLTSSSSTPMGPVFDVRWEGTVRIASMTATQDYANYKYIWRNVTCQKLSYDENTLVNSVQDPRLGTKFVDSECPLDKIGPYCSTSCTSHLEVEANCFGVVICEESGCTCPPGFVGMKCRKKCDIGKYGHDCNGTCGTCYRASCDSRTGHCTNGCDNSKRFNIPPHCKKGIDPPPPPEINFFNETTVIASIPARDEYKEITTEYLFIAKVNESGEIQNGQKCNPILPNTTKLVDSIDGLTPGTVYRIAYVLYVGNDHRQISGEFSKVTTHCTPAIVFDVEVEERGITLKKKEEKQLSYPCPEYWYVVILETVEPNKVVGRKVLEGLPHQFLGLTPDTRYKVTVGRENTTLFARETRTLEDAPSTVRNMTIKLLAHTEISLTWSPPEILNGVIRKYIIILRVITYYGCAALKRTVPEMDVVTTFSSGTTIIFPDLHPYAYYAAIVSACTSKCGPEQTTYFSIEASATPTAVFSNVKFENNVLSWESTMDCRTITGPIFGARILIDGVSDSVKTQHLEKVTAYDSITLNAKTQELLGAESYRARVYVIRGYKEEHNDAAYAETVFRVPPMPPPRVRNLEVYEVDVEGGKTSLRWQAPSPPLHGKLESYTVFKCSASCDIVQTIKPDAACELWENYICATVDLPTPHYNELAVSARNVNVSRPGVFLSVPVLRQEAAPVASKNFTVDVLDKGVVNVSWSHPWKSGGPLKRFLIRVQMLMTNRRDGLVPSQETIIEYPIKRPMRFYNFPLYLASSSSYKIVLCIVTNRRTCFIEDIKQIDTPLAIAFDGELRFEIREGESTIDLHIPPVLNDTKTSITHVIVKGPQPCEQYTELNGDLKEAIHVKDYEVAWRAATFPTDEFAGKVFQVGDNKLYDGVTNCPLKSEESYTIVVIVQTERESEDMISQTISIRVNDVPQRHDEAWVIPIIILVVAAAGFYFYRRKRNISTKPIILQDEVPLSHKVEDYDTKITRPEHKQILRTPTPSDRESLSRASTPDVTPIAKILNQNMEKTCLVKVKDFSNYVKQAIETGLMDRQYEKFPRDQTKPWDYGKLPQNKSKNRYGNLIAYDENRVVLKKHPDDPYSDYINANYIKGYKKDKCYIATQGPKPNTVIDFWQMIWQEQSLIICMLANVIENGKTKCEQYWPDIGKKKKYGNVTVLNAKHCVFADYTFRTFHLTCGDTTRKVEHLHYTAWPDHGVPLYTHSVVAYLKKLLATSPGNGPVVVHCSAGVGRTGTIILCDICLRRAAAEGVVDVFAETELIRSQRANMVDNKRQYLLAHLALVECLLSLSTALPCNDQLPAKIEEMKMQLGIQQQRLQDTAWQDEALRPVTAQTMLSERNVAKNRYPELISEKVSRIFLKRYPPSDEDSDYISAVYVDGVRQQNQYLASQLPMPSTLNDFWRMVTELNVELIVVLQPPDLQDATCCMLAPENGEFKPTPYIHVTAKEVTEVEHYTSQRLIVIDNSEKPAKEQQVTILCCTEWKPGRNQEPPSTMNLVTLWQATERISRMDSPTVLLCHDGVTGCGLYLALCFLLERMSVERECDVCLAIRAVRRSRPDFMRSLEHMRYLYDAALTYLEYFETSRRPLNAPPRGSSRVCYLLVTACNSIRSGYAYPRAVQWLKEEEVPPSVERSRSSGVSADLAAGRKMAIASSKSAKESKRDSGRIVTWMAKPIVDPELTEDTPLCDVYVGILKRKKDISAAIQSVTVILPGFGHLKRCSGNGLLLAPLDLKIPGNTEISSSVLSQDDLKVYMREKGFDLDLLEDDFRIKKVPRRSARTKAQAARSSTVWPVNFHPDPGLEKLLDGSIFDEDDLWALESYMAVVIEAAELEAVGDANCNGGAVMVDPADGRILAVAASRIDLHPMWHAAMLIVDLVAKLQGGGAWHLEEESKSAPISEEISAIKRDEFSMSSNRDDEQDLKGRILDIKRKYNEEAPLFYPKSLSKIRLPVQTSLSKSVARKGARKNGDGTTILGKKSEESAASSVVEKCGPYLCTGYWVFLLKEPCPMCAMALLHSRVSRIFYGLPNPNVGILGSKAVLHAVPGLNHRYNVWSGILERECQEASKKIEDRNVG